MGTILFKEGELHFGTEWQTGAMQEAPDHAFLCLKSVDPKSSQI